MKNVPRPFGGARRALLLTALLASLVAVPRPGGGPQDAGVGLLEQLRYPKTVVLVRHAEKGADDPRDPGLSAAGEQRARELARLLGRAGVTHLYASEFRRTRATLEPLSLVCGAAIQTVSARDPEALVSALAELPRGSLAVVAGHSNTVPALVHLLAPKHEAFVLSEGDHDRLYAVTLTGDRGPATVLELRFGAE